MTGVSGAVPSSGLGEEYWRHLAQKEARVRRRLAEHGLEARFGGILPCPVERGYRMQATFSASRGARCGIQGVDPRSGRVPWEASLWVLPEEARGTVERVVGLLQSAELGDAVTGFDVRLEYGSGRAHLRLAAPRAADRPLAPLCERVFAEVPGLLGVALPAQGIER
ncbi:MAG TPA: hypothetical protein VHG28_21075, partial [Longimicrobiaceae bacterium]|nr:hypothetical protein [Longimicrobiaceae bacterium]